MYRFMCEYMFFSSVAHMCWSGIAEPCGNAMFQLPNEGLPGCFPQPPYHCYFPIRQYRCSNFCTSLPPLVSCHYGLSHPSGCEVVFICVSIMINDVEHLFICLLVFGDMCIQIGCQCFR